MKVQESMLEQIQQIAAAEDRPVGYVARELMIRGLALYRVDGKLRSERMVDAGADLADVEIALSPGVLDAIRKKKAGGKIAGVITPGERKTTKADVRHMLERDAELLEDRSNKPKKVQHLGEITDRNAEKKRKAS